MYRIVIANATYCDTSIPGTIELVFAKNESEPSLPIESCSCAESLGTFLKIVDRNTIAACSLGKASNEKILIPSTMYRFLRFRLRSKCIKTYKTNINISTYSWCGFALHYTRATPCAWPTTFSPTDLGAFFVFCRLLRAPSQR